MILTFRLIIQLFSNEEITERTRINHVRGTNGTSRIQVNKCESIHLGKSERKQEKQLVN